MEQLNRRTEKNNKFRSAGFLAGLPRRGRPGGARWAKGTFYLWRAMINLISGAAPGAEGNFANRKIHVGRGENRRRRPLSGSLT